MTADAKQTQGETPCSFLLCTADGGQAKGAPEQTPASTGEKEDRFTGGELRG